jgi:hypothetical protein
MTVIGRGASILVVTLGLAAPSPGAFAQDGAPASPAPAPAKEAPAPPAVPAGLCQGRSVLVFEDARVSRLAMDGLIADIELMTASPSGMDMAARLVAGLKAAGCAVEHWEEPLVSVSVVDGKKTAFYGNDRKQEDYKPAHRLTGRELAAHDVVVWIKRASTEKTKSRHGEGLRIDYQAEAEVQARGQKKVALDASWSYTQDDIQAGYGGMTSYGDEEAARKKGVARFGPVRKEKDAAFDGAIRAAVEKALAALPPAAP